MQNILPEEFSKYPYVNLAKKSFFFACKIIMYKISAVAKEEPGNK